MKQYGLIGFPLTHSFSKIYFDKKFAELGLINHSFINYELKDIRLFNELIESHPNLYGLSVTIPYKEQIIPFIQEIDPKAEEIGAVNAIKIIRSESKTLLKGYNTDILGFEQSISPFLKPYHNKALILGSGGACKAIAFGLKRLNIEYKIVSRSKGELNYSDLDKQVISDHQIVINTTPLGMFPKVNECPAIPYQYLTENHLAFDLTYNPHKSLFLEKSEIKGATIVNGLKMLQFQADRAYEFWTKD